MPRPNAVTAAALTVMLDSVGAEPATGSHPRHWPGSGVGAQLAGRLAKLDIRGPDDLLLHLPLRYEDETRLTPIAVARPGFSVQVEGEVTSCEVVLRPRRQLVARISDASGPLVARWLHFYPSQQKQVALGRRVRLFGEVRGGFFGDEMIHPRIRPVEEGEALPAALTPVYPTTAGLGQVTLRKLIDRALASARIDDWEILSWKQGTALRTLRLRPCRSAPAACTEGGFKTHARGPHSLTKASSIRATGITSTSGNRSSTSAAFPAGI